MHHQVVSREEWNQQREALLQEEKAFTKSRDRLNAKRRALPWVRVEKNYTFTTRDGTNSLADLFENRSQLVIKHFMLGPGQPLQCVGCSLAVDHVEGVLTHLENHDVSYVIVARATIAEIEGVRQRMGWPFRWVSSFGSDFNYDFNVSFTREELEAGTAFYNYRRCDPGLEDLSGHSVFYKDDAGAVFHTYSCFARGEEEFLTIYNYLDVTPKGRDENRSHSMADWVKPRNAYGAGGHVAPNGRYHPNSCNCGTHAGGAI